MKTDYWEPGDQVFVHYDKRYGVLSDLRTTLIKDTVDEVAPLEQAKQPMLPEKVIHFPIPAKLSVTKKMNKCIVCGKSIQGKRIDRKLCSGRCRKIASRGKQLVLVR
jgi:hypothetical protein